MSSQGQIKGAGKRSDTQYRAKGPRRARSDHVTICILANHPYLLGQLAEDLSKAGLSAKTICLKNVFTEDIGQLSIPDASVYVVDAHDPFAALLTRALLNRFPKSGAIVVAKKFTDEIAFPFLELGARGLVSYADTHEYLAGAVRTVERGEYWISDRQLSRFTDSIVRNHRRRLATANRYRLSRREREVLQGLVENLSNKEIASRLNISEHTVKFHVSNLLAKFKVPRRGDLVKLQ